MREEAWGKEFSTWVRRSVAANFLADRLDSLERDARHCLAPPPAPFPVLLYCLATVDLLGALAAGEARNVSGTTGRTSAYLIRFMCYDPDQAALVMKLFRHKLVHLAEPSAL